MIRSLCAAIVLLAGTIAAAAQNAPTDAVKDLAPTGTLRAAINSTNVVLVQKDAATGALSGITPDLARELARRLSVPVQLNEYRGAGTVFAAAKTDAWDIGFVAIELVRAAEINFTAPYALVEGGYLVPANSPIKSIADVDRPGVRIGVGVGSAYDLFLTRNIKNATLHRASPSGWEATVGIFRAQSLDVAAGVKVPLVAYAKTQSDVRIIDGSFMEIQQAMGAPKGRGEAGVRYLKAFVEDVRNLASSPMCSSAPTSRTRPSRRRELTPPSPFRKALL